MSQSQLLTSADAARLLGVSAEMVRVLARRGKLRGLLTFGGTQRLFALEEVQRLRLERERKRGSR